MHAPALFSFILCFLSKKLYIGSSTEVVVCSIGTPLNASTTITTTIKHRKSGVAIELLESSRELNTSANTGMRQVVSNFDRFLDSRVNEDHVLLNLKKRTFGASYLSDISPR